MAISTAERLRHQLEQEILLFRLKPGDRLDETRLAHRFGTSRTPVREALRQLAASGLVKISPHRSAEVARLSIPELLEMFEAMALLEGACARLAAERASKAEVAAIRAAQDSCRPLVSDDSGNYYLGNVKFHEAIYRASHNSYMTRETILLRNRLAPYRCFQLRLNNRPATSFSEHEAVLEAIAAGDGQRAEVLMRAHIDVQGSNASALISNLPPEYIETKPPHPSFPPS